MKQKKRPKEATKKHSRHLTAIAALNRDPQV